jgi:hypothetical protein
MNTIIDRAQFDLAKTELVKINPCLDAISILVADNCFTDDDKKRLVDFQSWLSSHASKSKDVYDSGQLQYENRPQAMIRAAFALAENLRKEINLLEKASASLLARHIEKSEALAKQKFSPAEILKILPPPNQLTESNAELSATLQDKADRLWRFATDAPRFDASKISDIDLGGYLTAAEYQFSVKAA